MRNRALPLTTALLAFVLSTPALATPIQTTVPFEFVIGDKVLPPAAYIVETTSSTQPSVLTIRRMGDADRVMFDTNQMPEKADPKMIQLVFDTIGNKTYLTEVWGVTDSGREVKHVVDGHRLERPSEASRRRITASRIVDERDRVSEK
jgi:hypothetical protein